MHDELHALGAGNAYLEQTAYLIATDQHHEVVHDEHSDRMAVSVKQVGVTDPALASTVQDHGIHDVNLA